MEYNAIVGTQSSCVPCGAEKSSYIYKYIVDRDIKLCKVIGRGQYIVAAPTKAVLSAIAQDRHSDAKFIWQG